MKKVFFLAFLSLAYIGCTAAKNADTTAAAAPEAATALALPSSISVVGSSSGTEAASIQSLHSQKVGAFAFGDAGTDYANQEQHFHVYHEAADALQTVNSILCFIGQLFPNPDESAASAASFLGLVDKSAYIAMVDDSKCNSNSGGPSKDSAAGGASADSKSLVKAIVRIKSKNGDGKMPILIQLWFVQDESNGQMMIKAEAVAKAGKSTTRPIGDFSIYFKMFPYTASTNTVGAAMGGGELSIADGEAAYPMSFSFMESGTNGADTQSKNSRVMMDYDGANGKGLVSSVSPWSTNGAFAIAYGTDSNGKFLTSVSATTVAGLSGATAICQNMGSLSSMVWDYGFYTAATGAKVAMNAGFSCLWDANGDNEFKEGDDKHCNVGYHGVWAEPSTAEITAGNYNHTFSDGDKVRKKDWSNSANDTTYTLKISPGKLIKHTIVNKPLAELRGVDLQQWTCDNTGCFSYIVHYMTTTDDAVGTTGFYKIKTRSWGNNGPVDTAITPVLITGNAGERFNFWADQLSGSVQFVWADTKATMESQETVAPDSAVFAGGPLTLTCLGECPVTTAISNATLTSPSTPYLNFTGSGQRYPANMTDVTTTSNIQYTITNASGANWMRLVRGGTAVRLDSSLTKTQAQTNGYWNIRSGALVTSTAGLTNPWDVWKTVGSVFYTYEIGFDSWNQTIAAYNETTSTFASFDKPIMFNYTHATANDRNGLATYNGQTYRMEWSGDHLNGLPWVAKDTNNDGTMDNKDRWLPQIALKDGTLLGDSNEYVVKARFGEQFMNAAVSSTSCDGLATALASAKTLTLPTVAGTPSNEGTAMPTLKDDGVTEMSTCMSEAVYAVICDTY